MRGHIRGLELCRVVKTFGGRRLLDIEARTFPAGELHLIQGDNGAGKTTLFKILAGLQHADTLEFRFNGLHYTEANYPDALRMAELIKKHYKISRLLCRSGLRRLRNWGVIFLNRKLA